ncbi:MAG: PH domain-containing protein, partial [Chloroflexota bacterium]|nr:PH domain-containing protein [Chloroflexota bacterium]
MSYARKLLARGEEVTFESGQHWFAVVGRSWWAIILAILALAVLLFLVNPPEASLDGPGELVALVLLLVALGRIGWVIWGWRNTEFLVTTRRIIRAEGILNKRMSDSSLEKVNDAHLTQNLFGRIFGFGDLDILT